jgi:hypothetical protein
MGKPQESKKLKFAAITGATTYTDFEEIVVMDDAGVGFTITDSDNNAIVFAGSGITSIHIGGPGKPVNQIKVTPASGTINIMIYQ